MEMAKFWQTWMSFQSSYAKTGIIGSLYMNNFPTHKLVCGKDILRYVL